MKKIKNIIFDLGGIFLDIDYNKTHQAFLDLGVHHFGELYSQHKATPLFEDLETGKSLPEDFSKQFIELAKVDLTREQVEKAWSAMLGKFSTEALTWLEGIAKRYNIYLFSNTNVIHLEAIQKTFREQTGRKSFDDYFIKSYYSHTHGLRKPYPEAFLKILEQENLKADETLFIDDTPVNIEGAKKAGLQTILLQAPKTVLDLDL